MEKIQSAIAKARAARAAGPVAPPPAAPQAAPPEAPAAPGPDPAAVAAAWAALPAATPAPAQLARMHVVTAQGGREAIPFDQMRTRLLQQMRTHNWRRIAITSPGPACGKSTIALNLAFSLARQPDQRTVLAEMDFRRPSLARMLGLRSPQSFARVLEGLDPFAAQAVRIGTNLAVATNHAPHRHAAELLHSPSVATALDRIEAEFDPTVLIFDLPPMLATDDAMAVMGRMDAALLIAAAESTTISEIDRCEREIAGQSNVVGVVLNKCRYMGDEAGYDDYG